MPIRVKPRSIVLLVLFGVIPFLLFAVYYTTGYTYIPVEYTIGKCMKNHANTISYEENPGILRSTHLEINDAEVLICYGSQITDQKNVYGSQIPFDELWEFGINEPTRLYTNKDLSVGDVVVPRGRYSIYAIPGRWKWEIFISESTTHWGDMINEEVRQKEIGSFKVKPQYNSTFVEELTIRAGENELIAEWGKTRIKIPLKNLEEGQGDKHTTILSKFRASL